MRMSRHERLGRELAPFLERVYAKYHRPEYLGSDPLSIVHRVQGSTNREFAALFASLLAYGNVKQINASLVRLFDAMEWQPGMFVLEFDYAKASRKLHGFKHRFTDAEDVLCLCALLHDLCRKQSLQDAFLNCVDDAEEDISSAAGRFVTAICAGKFGSHFNRERMMSKSSFKHLLPRADAGSACKRIHLFLRWMAREEDGIDFRLWPKAPLQKLLIPVDTHVLRIANNLGITRRKDASLRTAREITAVMRAACPDDPVRYDFSLCRLGILKQCPTRSNLETCRTCEMHDVCARRKRLQRANDKHAATETPSPV
jgi:uncharacterized protein (TIGR02757 family)